MDNKSSHPETNKYVDKVPITYAKNPQILMRYFEDRPGELDEAINLLSLKLTNTKQIEDLISVELHLEERSKSHDPVNFRCSPKWTVYTAKVKIAEQFSYEISWLYVLYKKKIASEWWYLRDCGVEQNNDVLYVYIYRHGAATAPKAPHVTTPVQNEPLSSASLPGKSLNNIPMDLDFVTAAKVPRVSAPEMLPVAVLPAVSLPGKSLNDLPMDLGLETFGKDALSPNTGNIFDQVNLDMPENFDSRKMGKLWACKACTFLNEGWRTECFACDSKKPEDTSLPFIKPADEMSAAIDVTSTEMFDLSVADGWICTQCKYSNKETDEKCQMCDANKVSNMQPLQNEIMDFDIGTSQIAQGSNHVEPVVGNLLGEVMQVHKDDQEPPVTGWKCPQCTYLNEATRPGCELCSLQRPDDFKIPTWHQPSEAEKLGLQRELEQEQKAEEERLNERKRSYENHLSAVQPNAIHSTGHAEFGIVGLSSASERPLSKQTNDKQPPATGWRCRKCTYVNEATRPGCEICSNPRPDDFKVPEGYEPSESEKVRMRRESEAEQKAEEERLRQRRNNYERHVSAVDQSIVQSIDPVECMICFTEADPQDTIVLRECLHRFCKDCIVGHIVNSEEAVVTCPYADDNYKCDWNITEREVRALLNPEQFQKYLDRGLRQAEKASPNSFHCKTPDCQGWCVYEDQVNTFHCPVCNTTNCLTCKAIHENLDCKQYQDELQLKSATDQEARQTRALLDKMVKDGEAMHCPQCNIIIQKKVGCDWLRCPMCKVEICWVTKGLRWGPKGRGDISGGCHCRESGKKCHKNCNNCH